MASPSPGQLSARLAALGLEGRVAAIGPADASDLAAMQELAAKTRVILACLPDYRYLALCHVGRALAGAEHRARSRGLAAASPPSPALPSLHSCTSMPAGLSL